MTAGETIVYVEQAKTRSDGQFTLTTNGRGALTDLLSASRNIPVDEQATFCVATNQQSDQLAVQNWRRDAEHFDYRRPPVWFNLLAKDLQCDDPAGHRALRRLLANLEIESRSIDELEQQVRELLRPYSREPDRDIGLSTVVGWVMGKASEGRRVTLPELLRGSGLNPSPLTRTPLLKADLDRTLKEHLNRVWSAAPQPTWVGAEPKPDWQEDSIRLITGAPEMGKTWRLARLAQNMAALDAGPMVIWATDLDDSARQLQRALCTSDTLDFARFVSRWRSAQALEPEASNFPWLLICLDRHHDQSVLQSLPDVDWLMKNGIRVAITIDGTNRDSVKQYVERHGFAEEVCNPLTRGNLSSLNVSSIATARLPREVLNLVLRPWVAGRLNLLSNAGPLLPDLEYQIQAEQWSQLPAEARVCLKTLARDAAKRRAEGKSSPAFSESRWVSVADPVIRQRLVAQGWLRPSSFGSVCFAEPRKLGWAVAAALVDDAIDGVCHSWLDDLLANWSQGFDLPAPEWPGLDRLPGSLLWLSTRRSHGPERSLAWTVWREVLNVSDKRSRPRDNFLKHEVPRLGPGVLGELQLAGIEGIDSGPYGFETTSNVADAVKRLGRAAPEWRNAAAQWGCLAITSESNNTIRAGTNVLSAFPAGGALRALLRLPIHHPEPDSAVCAETIRAALKKCMGALLPDEACGEAVRLVGDPEFKAISVLDWVDTVLAIPIGRQNIKLWESIEPSLLARSDEPHARKALVWAITRMPCVETKVDLDAWWSDAKRSKSSELQYRIIVAWSVRIPSKALAKLNNKNLKKTHRLLSIALCNLLVYSKKRVRSLLMGSRELLACFAWHCPQLIDAELWEVLLEGFAVAAERDKHDLCRIHELAMQSMTAIEAVNCFASSRIGADKIRGWFQQQFDRCPPELNSPTNSTFTVAVLSGLVDPKGYILRQPRSFDGLAHHWIAVLDPESQVELLHSRLLAPAHSSHHAPFLVQRILPENLTASLVDVLSNSEHGELCGAEVTAQVRSLTRETCAQTARDPALFELVIQAAERHPLNPALIGLLGCIGLASAVPILRDKLVDLAAGTPAACCAIQALVHLEGDSDEVRALLKQRLPGPKNSEFFALYHCGNHQLTMAIAQALGLGELLNSVAIPNRPPIIEPVDVERLAIFGPEIPEHYGIDRLCALSLQFRLNPSDAIATACDKLVHGDTDWIHIVDWLLDPRRGSLGADALRACIRQRPDDAALVRVCGWSLALSQDRSAVKSFVVDLWKDSAAETRIAALSLIGWLSDSTFESIVDEANDMRGDPRLVDAARDAHRRRWHAQQAGRAAASLASTSDRPTRRRLEEVMALNTAGNGTGSGNETGAHPAWVWSRIFEHKSVYVPSLRHLLGRLNEYGRNLERRAKADRNKFIAGQ